MNTYLFMYRNSDKSVWIWFLLRFCNWWQKILLSKHRIRVYFTCLQDKSWAVVELGVKGSGRSGNVLFLCFSEYRVSFPLVDFKKKFWVKFEILPKKMNFFVEITWLWFGEWLLNWSASGRGSKAQNPKVAKLKNLCAFRNAKMLIKAWQLHILDLKWI